MSVSLNFMQRIRAFEADHGLKPSSIEETKDGKIRVTIDKSVLYQYDHEQKQTAFQKFWLWFNDRNNSFDTVKHADELRTKLNEEKNDISVSVKKRYIQLPIPYFSIPIPIEASGTQVRDYDNLATQKIKVSITFPADYSAENAVKKLITAATLSAAFPNSPPLPTAARRPSLNLIKLFLHLISPLMPRRIAQKFPQALLKTTRPHEWGTLFCETHIDHGFINSGAVASIINIPWTPAAVAFNCSMNDSEGGEPLWGKPHLHGHEEKNNENNVQKEYLKQEIYYYHTDRTNMFFSTRTALRENRDEYLYASDTQGKITKAIKRTFDLS